jgi:phosphate-selective porin OprO/OprP
MNPNRLLLVTALVLGMSGQRMLAEESTNELEVLKQRIEELDRKVKQLEGQKAEQGQAAAAAQEKELQIHELDQKLRILERQRELDQEAAAEAARAAAQSAPVLSVGPNGFSVRSADTNFVFSLHGLLQMDSRIFFANGGILGVDGFILRRARPILAGTVYRDFDFLFVPDFGGSAVQIQDAYVNYRYRPEVQLQAGKFKAPVGLELLQSDAYCYLNERALATDLVPNRNIGLELHGDLAGGTVSYAGGIFNSTQDYNGTTSNQNFDNNPSFIGRLFFLPFKTTSAAGLKGLGLGAGGSYEVDQASSAALTSGYTTDGQQKFFTYTNGVVGNGTHWRVSPQGYYYVGPFSAMGEYAISDQEVRNVPADLTAELRNTAWEISSGWVLTGEDASYNGIVPKRPFNPRNGDWGAFQIAGRYAQLHVDPDAFPDFSNPGVSASQARSWAVGMNWYLNRDIRINASYSHTAFAGGNGPNATVTKQPEQVFFTRVQLVF